MKQSTTTIIGWALDRVHTSRCLAEQRHIATTQLSQLYPDSIRDSIRIRIAAADSIQTKISESQVPTKWITTANADRAAYAVHTCHRQTLRTASLRRHRSAHAFALSSLTERTWNTATRLVCRDTGRQQCRSVYLHHLHHLQHTIHFTVVTPV